MKKSLSTKIFSLIFCFLFFSLMVSKTALAVEADGIMPRAACSSCGGSLSHETQNVRTNTVIGTCENNASAKHYLAYRVSIYQCRKCGSIENETIIATGHYCDCDCEGTGGWCWD